MKCKKDASVHVPSEKSILFIYLIRIKTPVTFSANTMQFFLLIQSAQFWHDEKDISFPLTVIHLFTIKGSRYTGKTVFQHAFSKILARNMDLICPLTEGFY